MAHTQITIGSARPFFQGPGSSGVIGSGRSKIDLLNHLQNWLAQERNAYNPDIELLSTTGSSACATAGLTISGGSGAVGAIINGVTVTATWASSDTNSAALAAAAINASVNSLVQGFVTSNNLSTLLTLASVVAGTTINICDVRFTATATATGNPNEFSIAGTDAQDATALAAAISAHPSLQRWVYPVVTSNTVRLFARQWTFASNVFSWPTSPGAPSNRVWASAATVTVSSATLAAGTSFGLVANTRGNWGNAISVALSGTGVTVIGAQARLLLGLGGQAGSVIGV